VGLLFTLLHAPVEDWLFALFLGCTALWKARHGGDIRRRVWGDCCGDFAAEVAQVEGALE
jgi:hypothetical protein